MQNNTLYKVKSKCLKTEKTLKRYIAIRYLSLLLPHYLNNYPTEEIYSIKIELDTIIVPYTNSNS
jgi:hypothetical protein